MEATKCDATLPRPHLYFILEGYNLELPLELILDERLDERLDVHEHGQAVDQQWTRSVYDACAYVRHGRGCGHGCGRERKDEHGQMSGHASANTDEGSDWSGYE